MIKLSKNIFPLLFLFAIFVNAQTDDNTIQVKGDSLVGRNINGKIIREVYNNVVITQGDMVITCDKAVQFISDNNVELIGNVIIKQDSITIETNRGFYFGDDKRTSTDEKLKLYDGDMTLTAGRGKYSFDKHIAFFKDNVTLTDTASTLTSDSLLYFKDDKRMVAMGNVKIIDSTNTIYSDSLNYFRTNKNTIADFNVVLKNKTDNTVVFGGHLENYPKRNYSIVSDNPILLQIDTTFEKADNKITGKTIIDTLIISAKILEAFRDSSDMYIVKDSVKILRGNFASVNDKTLYYRKDKKLITTVNKKSNRQPVLWYENTQITGDSINIKIKNNKIDLMFVDKNVFVISQNDIYKDRFDQTSGDSLYSFFKLGKLYKTNIYGNVYSIYYQYDNDKKNGLSKSSSKLATMNFDKKRIKEIRLYGTPNTEFHPERLVKGKEADFVLPNYVPFKKRPEKKELLEKLNKFKHKN